MKAAVQHRYGSPDVLQIEEVPVPDVGPGDVLIAVNASPVTQGDRRLRAADFPGYTALFGRLALGLRGPRNPIPGTAFSGRVVEVGEDVTRFVIGDRIFGSTMHGTLAERLVLPADSAIARVPDGVSLDAAAATPYGGGAALSLLRSQAAVQPGESVLVIGAAGGVGRFVVQVAVHLGATVTAVCSAEDAALVTELGAADVVDYRTQDFRQLGRHWDVVVDTVSGDGFSSVRSSLNPGGRYATVYATLRVLAQMAWTRLFGPHRALTGVSFGDAAETEELAELLSSGALVPVIASRHPLASAAAAHAELETDNPAGAVLVVMEPSVRRAA